MINLKFTIITGLSGAGRSSALKTLEDMGCFCSDNIPPVMIPEFAQVCLDRTNPSTHVAVVADMRMGDMFDDIYAAIDKLRSMPMDTEIIFLDATDEVIISRFKQTRRIHPVSGSGMIIQGIFEERKILQKIKEMADIIIDTSTLSARLLAGKLIARYDENHDNRLLISVVTFGYKRGIPMDADMVFDVRFLPNPFYIEELRKKSGLTQEVSGYVFSFAEANKFIDKVMDMVREFSPCYIEQDKKQLVIGIGCTGGMHRSVAMGEELFKQLKEGNFRASIEHRDLNLEQKSVEMRFSTV